MFDHDVIGEPDEDLLAAEGRQRFRISAPALTDVQFQQWLADVRQRGGRLELVPGGVIAVYDRRRT